MSGESPVPGDGPPDPARPLNGPPTPPASPEDGGVAPAAAAITGSIRVPARRARPPDPWAHRRGEPRVFAFLWTVFLFGATAITFMAAASLGGGSAEVMRPATRALLAVTAAGVCILWPMVRLSQLADEHPVAGVVQDLVVVLVPAQAVIWPQWLGWLGRWPLEVIAALSALMAAWGLLTGGLLALAQVAHRRADAGYGRFSPIWWMALFLALSLGGAVVALFPETAAAAPRPFRAGWMLSPIASVFEITRDRSWSGVSAAVAAGHWVLIGAVAGVGLGPWLLAAARARGGGRGRRLH